VFNDIHPGDVDVGVRDDAVPIANSDGNKEKKISVGNVKMKKEERRSVVGREKVQIVQDLTKGIFPPELHGKAHNIRSVFFEHNTQCLICDDDLCITLGGVKCKPVHCHKHMVVKHLVRVLIIFFFRSCFEPMV